MIGLSIALLASGTTPAHAQAAGDGAVSGTVTVSPGIDLTTRPTSFAFGATVITGDVTVRDTVTGQVATYAGQINVGTVTGGSPAENTISASGVVFHFDFSGSTTVGPVTTTISGTINGGVFVRVGPTVLVTLQVKFIRVTTVAPNFKADATVNGGTVVVGALFVPAAGQNGLGGAQPPLPPIPGGNAVTNASFNGNFAVVAP